MVLNLICLVFGEFEPQEYSVPNKIYDAEKRAAVRRARLGLLHTPKTSRRSASGPVQRLWAGLPRRPTSYVTVILARREGH